MATNIEIPDYNWTPDSALWQIQHGEFGTAKTEDAFYYLESEATDLERALINAIRELHNRLKF